MKEYLKKELVEALRQLNLSKESVEKAMYHLRQVPSVSPYAVVSFTMLRHSLEEIIIEIENVKKNKNYGFIG